MRYARRSRRAETARTFARIAGRMSMEPGPVAPASLAGRAHLGRRCPPSLQPEHPFMTVTANSAANADARRDDLAGRLMTAALGALEMQAVYLGDRLGLYRSLAEEGPATPAELAERAGIHPRYAREWLEQQSVAA